MLELRHVRDILEPFGRRFISRRTVHALQRLFFPIKIQCRPFPLPRPIARPLLLQAGREHPVAAVVRELWPVLEAISARHQSSGQVYEKLCRFFKHAMRTCKEHFEPLLKVHAVQ